MRRSDGRRACLLGVAAVAVAVGAAAIACSAFDEDQRAGDGGAPNADVVSPDTVADGNAPVCPPGTPFATDRNNCGACGHSCLGGPCVAGVCKPFEIGRTTGEEVVDIAVNDSRVYWMTSAEAWVAAGHLYACPKTGCTEPPMSLAQNGEATGALVGDGTTAFATFVYGWRKTMRIDDVALTKLPGDHANAVRLQIHGGQLHYLALYEPAVDAGFGASVFRLTNTAEELLATYVGPDNIRHYAQVGSRVFLATSGQDKLLSCTVPCAGGFTEFKANVGGIYSVTTDGSQLFYSAVYRASVMRTPPDSFKETAMLGAATIGAGASPRHVRWDHGVLLVTTSNGRIYTCTSTTCDTTPIAEEPRLADRFETSSAVVADDQAFYWAAGDDTDGDASVAEVWRIMKLAR
jgi:hypothetical protein